MNATAEKLTVIGTLEGITEKPSGWTTIAVSVPGKQYPVKMDTKLEKLIEQARAAGTGVMTWTYTESDSGTPNPNKPGSNYVDRRFQSVEPYTEGAEHAAVQQAVSGQQAQPRTGLTGADKDRAITRMACLKAAAESINAYAPAHVLEDPALEVMKIAQRYEQWVYRDITEVPF